MSSETNKFVKTKHNTFCRHKSSIMGHVEKNLSEIQSCISLDKSVPTKSYSLWEYLYINSNNLNICISQMEISRKLNMPISTVQTYIRKLKQAGYLKITQRKNASGQSIPSKIQLILPGRLYQEIK